MAQNSMKGTQAFQDTIRTYLDNMAESDALFAVKYANPSKSLSECITYIICYNLPSAEKRLQRVRGR